MALLFHTRNIDPRTCYCVDCPRVARNIRTREMEGERKAMRLQLWLGGKWTNFKCLVSCFLMFFPLLILYQFSH